MFSRPLLAVRRSVAHLTSRSHIRCYTAAGESKKVQRKQILSTSFRDKELGRIYDNMDVDKKGVISNAMMRESLEYAGLHESLIKKTLTFLDADNDKKITRDDFLRVKDLDRALVERALKGDLVIPDFPSFQATLSEVYDLTQANETGRNADYIPQLRRVDSSQFGAAVCTIDAQVWEKGHVDPAFTVQSTSKPVTYCITQELVGAEKLQKHVGHEPSGREFNAFALDKFSRPHNPMINLGAIMTASLMRPRDEQASRFDYVTKFWGDLCGSPVSFDNAVYLSELEHADRNFSLAYMAKDAGAFDKDVTSHQDITKQLEFYFMCCSITLNCSQASIMAATLANGGVNPLTQKRVFSSSTVRDCLSLMYSCGMYDYSGQFAFEVGLPAKSGVAGLVILVIPGVAGVAVWSPRLDSYGNSARGVEFCGRLAKQYTFHLFDGIGTSKEDVGRHDPTKKNEVKDSAAAICELNFAAAGEIYLSNVNKDG